MFPSGPRLRPTPGYSVLTLVTRINCAGAPDHLSTSDTNSETAGSIVGEHEKSRSPDVTTGSRGSLSAGQANLSSRVAPVDYRWADEVGGGFAGA